MLLSLVFLNPSVVGSRREKFYRHSCSHRWDLQLGASKSFHLSIGAHTNHRVVLSKETEGKLMTNCYQINDLVITVNLTFTPQWISFLLPIKLAFKQFYTNLNNYFCSEIYYHPNKVILDTLVINMVRHWNAISTRYYITYFTKYMTYHSCRALWPLQGMPKLRLF